VEGIRFGWGILFGAGILLVEGIVFSAGTLFALGILFVAGILSGAGILGVTSVVEPFGCVVTCGATFVPMLGWTVAIAGTAAQTKIVVANIA
jgi:hypothetical protein